MRLSVLAARRLDEIGDALVVKLFAVEVFESQVHTVAPVMRVMGRFIVLLL